MANKGIRGWLRRVFSVPQPTEPAKSFVNDHERRKKLRKRDQNLEFEIEKGKSRPTSF